MTFDQGMQLVEQLKEIIAALTIAIPLVIGFWKDAKRKAAEIKEGGFREAAEELYSLGEEIKGDWRAAGEQHKDLGSRLRALAPGLLMRYGVSEGFSEADMEKVLGLAASIHKARKVVRGEAVEIDVNRHLLETEPEYVARVLGATPEGRAEGNEPSPTPEGSSEG